MSQRDFCSNCGQLTENTLTSLCQNCLDAEQNEYVIIRDYLKRNPRSSAMDISLATNISINKITKYIKNQAFVINE